MINKNFAYILGVFVGDGFANENSIIMNVKDKDFALEFKRALEKEFGKKCKFHLYNGLWRVLLHGRKEANFIKNFDINEIRKANITAKAAFLRGFFDSEGSVYVKIKYGVTNRKVEIVNKNYLLINLCKNLLEDIGIRTRKIDKRFRKERFIKNRKLPAFEFYRLILRENKDNFIKFYNLVGFSIQRRQIKLREIINSYREFRNKWGNLKNKILELKGNKRYIEIRKEFNFIPKSTIDR